MPNTRSAMKKQTKLEDVIDNRNQQHQPGQNAKVSEGQTTKDQNSIHVSNASTKRKSASSPTLKSTTPKKKQMQRQQQLSSNDIDELDDPIVINRAPVLQLWGAVVAHFLHPDLSWAACLSIGNAISSLCAISKGKAIGMIEPKDDTDATDGQKNNNAKTNTEEVAVMGFNLHLDGDAVLLSGKPKPFSESTLKNKFGEQHYEAAKAALTEALKTWDGDIDELDRKAFHMYEKFRPDVASGQRGWGRKGELNLHVVKNTIMRS